MKRTLALLLAFVMVLSLCACGAASTSAASTSTASTSSTTEAAPAADTSAAETDATPMKANGETEAIADKVVVQIQAIDDLGPFQASAGATFAQELLFEIYQTMASRNSGDGDIVNVMMTGYEDMGNGVYNVTIEDGIVDSNGNAIKASDVVFSYNTCTEIGEATVMNYMASAEALDDTTVQITMTENATVRNFIQLLTDVRVVSQASYEASPDGMATTPVGSGPYKLDKFVTGSEIVLVADDNYWESEDMRDASNEMQNVKTIDYTVLSESSQVSMALQTGSIDMTENVNAEDLPVFQEGGQYSNGHGIITLTADGTYVLAMNCSETSPLSDPKVREAIMLAVDPESLAGFVNGGDNEQGIILGSQNYVDYDARMADYLPTTDIDAAKAALAESSYPDGCTISLAYIADNTTVQDISVILIEQLNRIGITLEANGLPFPSYMAAEKSEDGWDLIVAQLSNSTRNNIDVWYRYFSMEYNGGHTTNWVVDDTLEEKINTCYSEDGHTGDNMVDLWAYIMENDWMLPLFVERKSVVYNSNLITGFGYNAANIVVPGACSYK